MASFGVSFTPGGGPQDRPQQEPGQTGGANPLQSAIQLLSLRLPRVMGANAIAPRPLLQSQGAGGMPPEALEMILQRLFGQMSGGMGGQTGGGMAPAGRMGPFSPGGLGAPSAPPAASAGLPRIIPGEGPAIDPEPPVQGPRLPTFDPAPPANRVRNPMGPEPTFGPTAPDEWQTMGALRRLGRFGQGY